MGQSKLKFLVDVGIGKKVEDWLLRNEYDVKAVRNINPKMDDDIIIRYEKGEVIGITILNASKRGME